MTRIICVIQARQDSKRFPRKVLAHVSKEVSVIKSVFLRIRQCEVIDEVIFGIPDTTNNNELAEEILSFGGNIFRGSASDVQSRFLEIGERYSADFLLRITGDCPLVDPTIARLVIERAIQGNFDYVSNVYPPTYPDGLDVEVFSLSALKRSREISPDRKSKEHVTWHLRESGLFRINNIESLEDHSELRWTVDYKEDLRQISGKLPENFIFMSWEELLKSGFTGVDRTKKERNEGAGMNSGQKVWVRAKTLIPGGSMLLSKRPEMFLPEQWPTYYSKAKGIRVWDLDGNPYIDFSTMSVGACSLGYGNPTVDESVKMAIDEGVMSSLNSPGEVELAEKLIALHPWADMARFARSGGEANAIAVRIARASTKRDKIAICGYHGWHDWYLAANLASDSNLDGHLMPGLDVAGVPRALVGSTVPFLYNDAKSLEDLLKTGEFAAVQMEVSRNFGPNVGFLEKVRQLCSHYKVILIFDECTSGFRETYGGLHLKFGVDPDLAMFGKALGNGYAITAVIGRSSVMQSAQSTFISSTFWTERLGPVAALNTLSEMSRLRSWDYLPNIGRAIKDIWSEVLKELDLPHHVAGIDALPTFTLNFPHWMLLRTLFVQEMLERGYLSTSGFYSSTAHSIEDVSSYKTAFKDAMLVISENREERDAAQKLRGPVAQSGFTRLN